MKVRNLRSPRQNNGLMQVELLRPWKLMTFGIGMAWLLYGATHYDIPDWDVGISIIMGMLTYVTAPWAVRILIARRYKYYPLALFFYWLTVDGSYWLYHTAMGNQMFRVANFYASTPFYFLCGFIWLHKGPLKDLIVRKKLTD
jgi:hypothetical protein